MEQELLSRRTENTWMITAEFLEDGHILKSGRAKFHSYRLDLLVRNDMTLDQLLGAVYAGIRKVLTERYQLDLSQNLAGIVYQDLQDPFAIPTADGRKRRLRRRIVQAATLRAAAMRYRGQRRRIRELEQRYPMLPDQSLSLSPEKKERLGWIVCWQVYHECYRSYLQAPPEDRGYTADHLCHPVIALGGVTLRPEQALRFPLLRCRDGGKTLRELGFVPASRLIFDPVLWHHSAALYDNRAIDPTVGQRLSFYKTDNRPLPDGENTPYPILQPRNPVPVPRMDPIPLLLPPVLTTSAVVGTWALAGQLQPDNLAMVLCAMFGSTLGLGVLYHQLHRFQYHRAMRRWVKPYEEYIRSALTEIRTRQDRDIRLLKQLYPPVITSGEKNDLVHRILEANGELFARRPPDRDFLKVRIGLSAEGSHLVPSLFPVTGELKHTELSAVRFKNLRGTEPDAFELTTAIPRRGEPVADMPVELLPQAIAQEFGYLYHAPVLLDLRRSPVLGIVFPDSRKSFLPFLSNLVLDLCAHHSPEHLQFVMLCPETPDWKERQAFIDRFKHLPHFGELTRNLSPFAFDRSHAWKLFHLLRQRLTQRSHGVQCPHIVVLALEEYDLREHDLRAWMPENPEQTAVESGISFLLCKHSQQALPSCCTQVIRAENRKEWFCLPADRLAPAHRSGWGAYRFHPDLQPETPPHPDHRPDADRLYRACKLLSVLSHRRQACSLLPAYVELFALHMEPSNASAGKEAYLKELNRKLRQTIQTRWAEDTMSFPLGQGEQGIVRLELCEAGAGAHLLLTGDPGTGKTTSAVSCLLSICACQDPEHLEVIPVDHQGTGLHRMLQDLPHVRRSPITGSTRRQLHEQIRELICRLDEVCLDRRKLLSAARLDHIDRFNAMFPDRPLHHLVVAIDDYDQLTHLLRNAPLGEPEYDLDAQLLRLLGTCRGLGIHLVLICRPMEHRAGLELMEQMPVRLCLKLSDREMSRRILGIPAAADPAMPGRGRAYLTADGGNTLTCLQLPDPNADVGGGFAPLRVTWIPAGGSHQSFFDSATDPLPTGAEVHSWANAAAQPLPADRSRPVKAAPASEPRNVPTGSGDFVPGQGGGDAVPGSGSGDFAPDPPSGDFPPDRKIPHTPPEPEAEDFIPGESWEAIRRHHNRSDAHDNWRKSRNRSPVDAAQWVRPDAALLPPTRFGITQREFLIRLIRDLAADK